MNLEERKELPLNGPSNYRVDNNIIYTKTMEINATKHCNLSCRGCSHSAPTFKDAEYDLETLKMDLNKLKSFIRCDIIRVVGGEPLLHSNFMELIKIIKESNISNKISLITNGILLPTIDIMIFNNIDELEVSIYPLNEKMSVRIKEYVQEISHYFTKVRLLEYNSFREPFTNEKSQDEELVQNVYDTCQISHFWRCITIDNGFLYRCPQSMINAVKTNDYSDALKIDDISDYRYILSFLENNFPIKYCYKCLGSVGKIINHDQINKSQWENAIPKKYEQSIDKIYMQELFDNIRLDMKCTRRSKIK